MVWPAGVAEGDKTERGSAEADGVVAISVVASSSEAHRLQHILSSLLLSTDKSKVDISQNFVAFSEYMNFAIFFKANLQSLMSHPFLAHKKLEKKFYHPPCVD